MSGSIQRPALRRVDDGMGDPTAILTAMNRVLAGRYRLTTRLAVGGMGEVWVATDELLDRRVAVKILRDEFVESPVFLARFRSEAKHTAALAHPGIATIFDYGEEAADGRCTAYLVMELVDGPPLSDLLAARGPLPVPTTIEWLSQAAEALGAAHHLGVVHRDIKPGNLLIAGDTLKITDFGIARAMNSVPVTDAGQVVGTARYMAPEQAAGRQVTPASDVYSLGIVGYEMLTGRPPFTSGHAVAVATAHLNEQPAPLPPHVPAALSELLIRALAKDPTLRPADGDAFARELRSLQGSSPPPTAPLPADVEPATALTSRRVRTSATTARDAAPALTSAAAPTRIRDQDRTVVAPLLPPPPSVIVADHRSAKRSRRALVAAAIVLGVCIALLTATHRSSNLPAGGAPPAGSQQEAGSTVAPATSPSPSTVMLDPAVYVGMQVEQARRALLAQGFQVTVQTGVAQADSVVAGIAPTGPLAFGTHVTLTTTPATTRPAAPTTTTTTSAPAHGPPAKGKGKGKGK